MQMQVLGQKAGEWRVFPSKPLECNYIDMVFVHYLRPVPAAKMCLTIPKHLITGSDNPFSLKEEALNHCF
jgi:hypothetical protein